MLIFILADAFRGGQQDVGFKDVATGRGVLSLCSFKNPLQGLKFVLIPSESPPPFQSTEIVVNFKFNKDNYLSNVMRALRSASKTG